MPAEAAAEALSSLYRIRHHNPAAAGDLEYQFGPIFFSNRTTWGNYLLEHLRF